MQMFDALGTRQAQMVCSAQNRHLPRSHDQWLVHSVFLQQTNTPRKIQQKLRRSRVIIMKCMDWIMNKKMIRQWMKFNCWNNVDAQIEVKEISLTFCTYYRKCFYIVNCKSSQYITTSKQMSGNNCIKFLFKFITFLYNFISL